MSIPETIGRYEISEELGQGGMAVVYLARDPLMARRVAVKLLPRQFTFNESLRARFQREARIVASLEHPAIVPVYDFGEFNEQPYLVMRYMVGDSLSRHSQGRQLPLPEVVRILTPLSQALDKAHEQHIIHRDLKPDNILFDGDNNPYLSDFGIARLAEGTQTTSIMGTPAYMSPEQITGDVELDGRSDIYALGVILFEMLSGTQPFTGETPTNIMMKHVMEPVPTILDVAANLPPETQGIIDKAMAKNREDRYETAQEMVTAINGLLTGTQAAEVGAAIAGSRMQETMLEALDPAPSYQATIVEVPADISSDSMEPPVTVKAQEPAKSKRPIWLMVSAIVVVLVLLCIVVWAAISLISGTDDGGEVASGTSGVSNLSASAGIATEPSALFAESSANAAETVDPQPQPTGTAEPKPTSTLNPVATNPPPTDEIMEIPVAQELFSDDFESNSSAADWDLWQDESAEFEIVDGRLTAVGKNEEMLNWTRQVNTFSEFETRVTADILQGDKSAFFGMVFAGEGEDYLGCFVQGDESAYCSQSAVGETEDSDWVRVELSRIRKDEILFVVTDGQWAMTVNEKCIGSGSNDILLEGQIGLVVSTATNDAPARVVYDDLLIQSPSENGLGILGCLPEFFE